MKTPACILIIAAALPAAPLDAKEDKFALQEAASGQLDFTLNGKTLGRYMFAHDLSSRERQQETYKPYLHVFDPEGKAPITKGPGGEYTHHRGIFIGWMRISVNGKSVDRWHMKGGEVEVNGIKTADIVHQKFSDQRVGRDGASVTAVNLWQGPENGAPMLEEERTMTFVPAPKPAYVMIDFTSKLKALAGDTKLEGDPEHAGLQFRPANEVDRTKTLYLYPKDNADPHKDRDYRWFAEQFTLGDKTYSVVFLNDPTNAKDAPISAYRNYGRFGAFLHGEIKKGETFTAKARFIVIQGPMPPADFCQKQWNAYTGLNEPVPRTTLKPAEGSAPSKAKEEVRKAESAKKPGPKKGGK